MRLACAPVWSGNSQPGGGRSPHAAAACLNAGDWRLTPGVAGMNIPPVLGNVGSGQFATPCLRMHCAWASAAARCASGSGDPLGRPPGCPRARAADGRARVREVRYPVAPARHRSRSRRRCSDCPRMRAHAVCELDPHPATASTQPTAASAIERLGRWLLGTVPVLARCMSRDSVGSASGSVVPDAR